MPTQVTNYQCPACTGPLHFVGASGKLECDYCGSTYDVAEIEALYAEKEAKAAETQQKEEQKQAARKQEAAEGGWDTSDMSDDWGDDADAMRAYSCPSCGAELLCDETTAATSCPYCGNPTVVPGKFAGALKPEYVLPFKLAKEDAVKALKAHYKGKPFLPKAFSAENHVQEIKGVYVPFWMFDGEAEGWANYKASRSHTHREGDYEVTRTEHFDVYREGSLAFEKVPVDASNKMPDDHMDSIEPFDYKELKPFSTAYLPGFLADKYDVSVEDSQERADSRCAGTLVDAMRDTVVGYDGCFVENQDIKLKRGKVHYALLPLQDASIAVTRHGAAGTELVAFRVSNYDGMTEPIRVETPDFSESQQSGAAEQPFASVDIEAEAVGYGRIFIRNAQIFADRQTVQPLRLIPTPSLPESYTRTQIVDVTPQDL